MFLYHQGHAGDYTTTTVLQQVTPGVILQRFMVPGHLVSDQNIYWK